VKKNDDDNLENNEEKLAYVIKKLGLVNKDIAKKMGMSAVSISQIKNYREGKLRNHHIYAICFAYNVPIAIFENKTIDTVQKVDELLAQQHKESTIFSHNKEILDKLVGIWYMYSYPSNPRLADVWETETTFYNDYRVIDEHENEGTLHIGKNQTLILKESAGSKNITSITFDNARIFYNVFLFSRVSKSNSMNKELFNFGICSRKKLKKDEVKVILGEVNEVQLQVNYDVLERISMAVEMDG
jgi:transcriptional regulator with XRE-family HTH domain